MKKNSLNNTIEAVDVEKYHGRETSEEVQDIIERMPTKFGLQITAIVSLIFIFMIFFGWYIRYPDIVNGKITINTATAPIKLVANSAGNLKLNLDESLTEVSQGDIIAYIKSATSVDSLKLIKDILLKSNPVVNNAKISQELPTKVSLGELTTKYYSFYSSIHQLTNFLKDKLYEKQIASLENLYHHQQDEVNNSEERIDLSSKNLELVKKFLSRDSLLFSKKFAAESEFDRSRIEYLNVKSGIANARTEQIEANKSAEQTIGKIKELEIQRSEKIKELELQALATYNDLLQSISSWEQQYLIRSPFDGKVQFLKFWTNDQFVQLQEPLFSIIPKVQEPYGQVFLKAAGAGKVKIGQEVIIKLDDFPYNEYGSIKGIVNTISLTTNTENTQQGNVETYLITLNLPQKLKTNYGKTIPFRHEIKGVAEIITNDRRLIERLFDNLKYAINK